MKRLVAALLDRIPGAVSRRVTPTSSAARLMRPLLNRLVPKHPRIVTVRSGPAAGIRLMIDPMVEKYYWTGAHEQHVQAALAGVLGVGDVFWDVGAHVGLMTLLAARAVGNTGQVVAFEPMPETRDRLRSSIAASEMTNVTIEPIAAASENGTRTLYASEASTMWSLEPGTGGGDGIAVTCLTLDSFMRSRAPAAPDVIKIDAEGAELDVIRGAVRLLEDHGPFLMVEFSTAEIREDCRLLLEDRYDWSHVGENHWLLKPVGRAGSSRR